MNPELVPEDELLDRAWLAVDEGEYGEDENPARELLAETRNSAGERGVNGASLI